MNEEFKDQLKDFNPRLESDPFEALLYETSVASLPIRPVTVVSPSGTVDDVMRQMQETNIGAALAVDEDNRIDGILTERDILKRVVPNYPRSGRQTVKAMMTKDPWVVYEIDNISTVLSVMAMTESRHVPVVDMDGKAIGIVTPRRIMRFLRDASQQAAEETKTSAS